MVDGLIHDTIHTLSNYFHQTQLLITSSSFLFVLQSQVLELRHSSEIIRRDKLSNSDYTFLDSRPSPEL